MRAIRGGIAVTLVAGALVPASASAAGSFTDLHQAVTTSGCRGNAPLTSQDAGPVRATVVMGGAYFNSSGFMQLGLTYGKPNTVYTVRYCVNYGPALTAGTVKTSNLGRASFTANVQPGYIYEVAMSPQNDRLGVVGYAYMY